VPPDQGLGGPNCRAVEAATSATTTSTTNSNWRVPLLAYLLDEILPADQTEARRIARRAKTYVAINGEIYKRSPSAVGMLMKCNLTHQGKNLLLEIHAGICGYHAASWSLVGKAFRQGFYWPTAQRDTRRSSARARGVSSTLGKPTCQRRRFRPSLSPGHSRFGGLIWSGLSRRPLVVSLTCLSWWTSSPSGLR
jgi:hypothetical protein